LIATHERETGSRVAESILRDWDLLRGRFWQICPREMIGRLSEPLIEDPELQATG
jgi:glutamate synthase (NADPH/NADH) large chain